MTAEQIARALGGKRSGNQWKCRCPAHADKDPSMIVFDGRDAVQVRCYAGCDPLDIITALRAMGLWGRDVDGDDVTVNGDPHEARRRRETPRTDPSRHGRLALEIWERSVDPRETPAEAYLKGRGLVLPSSAAVTALRYSECCPKGERAQPALVVLMRNVESFAPQAIQRLFLDIDQNRKTEAMMLGPVGNAAMMISSRADTFCDSLGFCPLLYVCEGLETALALHQFGRRPVWALGSAGAIARFPVIFGVGELTIAADNDENNVGLEAAVECAERWNGEKDQHFARIVMPRKPGTDFADAIQRK
jgi:hypothetical protein